MNTPAPHSLPSREAPAIAPREPTLNTPGRLRRGLIWTGLLVAIVAGALWGLTSLPDARERLARVPLAGESFRGADAPLTEQEQAAFARANVLHRHYRFQDRDFFLTIIDGTHDRHIVHDPQYCFRGAGWSIVAERDIPLSRGNARWVHATLGDKHAQAVYWFSDGRVRHASPLRYRWQSTLRRLTLGRSGPEPVMVMLQSVNIAERDWPALARDVCRALDL